MNRRETKRVGLIGYPVGHSLSPFFQQAAFDFHSLSARYELWEVPPDRLDGMVGSLRERNCLGANVTVPHKQSVMPLLDEIDGLALRVGAVNTIVNRNGRLVGFNTDVFGFLRSLREKAGYSVAGKRAVIIGAGGAAHAVAYALVEGQASSISIANRSLANAERLAAGLSEKMTDITSRSIQTLGTSDIELADVIASCDLLVNATSIGMLHSDSERETPLPCRLLHNRLFVFDLVYNPPETPLLRSAVQCGARVLNGLPMLIYQGAAAFELWTDREAPVGLMMARALEQLRH